MKERVQAVGVAGGDGDALGGCVLVRVLPGVGTVAVTVLVATGVTVPAEVEIGVDVPVTLLAGLAVLVLVGTVAVRVGVPTVHCPVNRLTSGASPPWMSR